MKKIQKYHHHMGLPAKLSAVLLIAVLLMSMLVFAQAEQTGATDDPYHFGLNEEVDPNAGKATGTPKPTKTPKPTATPTEFPFEPGIREDHTGHKTHNTVLEITDYMHRIREYCDDCQMKIRVYWEDHQLDAEGHCTKCSYRCKHDRTYVREVPADGGEKTWDGNWISYPGTEITVCYHCNKYLKYENTIIRKFHNRHTRFLPEQECLPHDADTHALVRICEDCGTEVIKYVPHNCPPSDRPYTDDVDTDTHSRLVRCDDCGFWVPQQQAHTWVHDSYTEFDGSGDYHNEVMRCSVCGAVKQVPRKHEWKLISCIADDEGTTHTSSYECTVCGDCKEIVAPHKLEHYLYKNDGNTESHIEMLWCTECGQVIEGESFAHKPTHLYWKGISDTQDQETVICNLCRLTYQQTPTAHQFDAKSYETNGYVWETNTGYHTVYQICSKCGARDPKAEAITEKHEFISRCCTKCNQAEGHNREHNSTLLNPGNWVAINEEQHAPKVACDNADYKNRKQCWVQFINYKMAENHTFDPITMKCTRCGYLKEGCEHVFKYAIDEFRGNENEHALLGTCTKCGKQTTVTEAHDMRFVSATEFMPGENGHTRTVTERCSRCGYENQYKETEAHIFSTGESLNDQEHRLICSVCGEYGTTEQHIFICTPDASAHMCSVCGEKGEHDYFIIERRGDKDWYAHTCVYQCKGCAHQKEEDEEHVVAVSYTQNNEETHLKTERCILCGIRTALYGDHSFDESGMCICGYRRGSTVSEALLSVEYLPANIGNMTTPLSIFCHLTADGKEIPHKYALVPLENGDAFSFIILPESISGDPVIEARFTASELALLQAFGVKSVYIRPGENDILLLDDVSQALTALTGQEIDELVITLTPGSDGVYTAQYDPAGVYITE